MSEDMSPYCSAHDEWLIKICLRSFMGTAHHSRDAATGFAAVATRPRAGCWSMEDRRRKSLINWPYQPKHSPSIRSSVKLSHCQFVAFPPHHMSLSLHPKFCLIKSLLLQPIVNSGVLLKGLSR